MQAKSSAEFIEDLSIRRFVQERKSFRKPPAPIRFLMGGRVASSR